MGMMVYSLFWVMQDLHHQPYVPQRVANQLADCLTRTRVEGLGPRVRSLACLGFRVYKGQGLGFRGLGLGFRVF